VTALIARIQIEGFRSFRRAELTDLDDYVPVIGLNSTGKSNVLRALNLFFNGVTDEERTPPAIVPDYPDFLEGRRRKKRLAVTVHFDLAGGYEVRNTQDVLRKHGIRDSLVIERSWTLGPSRVDLVDGYRFGPDRSRLADLAEQDRPSIVAFIQSVQFRYVPNHLRPADLIRSEIQALRPKLVNRLRRTKAYKDGGVDASIGALAEVAAAMFKPIEAGVSPGGTGRRIVPDIPSDFAELAFQVGLNTLTESGSVQPTELQGSGTQSIILLHVLHLLDSTMREQGFGWKQYTVWAMEEPESFLHAGLRTQFAEDLRRFSTEDRRQVFVTTHQDEFVRVADSAWLATLSAGETSLARMSTRDALQQSARLRISAYSHPLMSMPDHPILIVEGKTDALYLRSAATKSDRRPRWRLISLEDFDDTQGGGDNVKAYLSANRAVLASRPLEAPVFVLRDWEDGKHAQIDKVLRDAHEASRAWCCPEDLCNPDLGSEFRGIERFLPTKLIESVVPAGELRPHSRSHEYPLGIDGSALHRHKRGLAERFEADAFEPGPHLVRLYEWVDDEVQRAFGELPPTLFA
jgi:hypothetical protein